MEIQTLARPAERVARARGPIPVAWAGRPIVAAVLIAAAWTLATTPGGGVSRAELGASWQLVDLRTLGDDPLGSVWHLHTQPPLHNLVVGIVLWLPVPVAGTLFLLYTGCLLAAGLLLQDLLVRWRLGPLTAGVVAALAMVNPAVLDTIHHGSYELPVATFLVAALWAAQRYLRSSPHRPSAHRPSADDADDADDHGLADDRAADGSPAGPSPAGAGWLVLVSVLLTLGCLTRSLLHPVWLAGALMLLLLARPVRRSTVVTVLLIPALLVGGWMGKNQALFETPTLSSWLGFNLQRGVVAPMEDDAVRASVRDGAVSRLATRQPWGELNAYASLVNDCTPRRDHRAASAPTKVVGETGLVVANFNHECYLPLYGRASDDAITLARRYPGRYLRTRASALTLSFTSGDTCGPRGCTWMDALYAPLLGEIGAEVPMGDWNLPLPGADDPMEVEVGLTLVAAAVALTGRGIVAAVRLARRWRLRPHGWPAEEVLWALAAWTVVVVVVGGDLVELGENGRFRTAVDPLLVALPLGALARRLASERVLRGGPVSPWRRPSWARRPG